MTDETHDLVPLTVKPLMSPEEAAAAWRTFENLKQKLLTSDDYQVIAGKRFITKSGFRKIAVCFDISDRILESEKVERPDGSFYWKFVVEAKAPNGRVAVGVAICDSNERRFNHPEHDILSTSHTRAKSRAVSDLVAGGATSAEEMIPFEEADSGSEPETPQPKEEVLSKVKLKRGHSWDKIFAEFGPEIQIRQQELGELWTFESAAIVFARERGFVKKD